MKNAQIRVGMMCKTLFSHIIRTTEKLTDFAYVETGYKGECNDPPHEGWSPFAHGGAVKGRDAHFWFRTHIKTGPAQEERAYRFQLVTGKERAWNATNPQAIVYLNGRMTQGLDTNHNTMLLDPDTEYELLVYFYTGLAGAECRFAPFLQTVDCRIERLYWDLYVPFDGLTYLDPNGMEYAKTLRELEAACNLLDLREPYSENYYRGLVAAEKHLAEHFYGKLCGNPAAPTVHCIGHTHIDVAWQWEVKQTREKAQRSFATMVELMRRYPEFKFMSSQPQLYRFVKEDAPELYEDIRGMVRDGRWEVEGAMWLEADCNLISGESFVRQILYGKRFMREEFGVESKVLWLPDVFGYSAALPQILKKSGVDYFVTSKISWNDHNKMPYDSFMWQGIDGTEIFSTFLTAQNAPPKVGDDSPNYTTYNAQLNSAMVMGTHRRYQQKEYSDHTLLTFGFGDGGGGATPNMLESYRRLEKTLPGYPCAQMSFSTDYLALAEREFRANSEKLRRMPRWVGELYLEFHRGTYTSQARNKRNNRKSELLLQMTEALCAWNMLGGDPYPQQTLSKAWETVLLNQFHDIIPGSSIHEVYEVCDREYHALAETIGAVRDGALARLVERVSTAEDGFLIYNPLSFARADYVTIDGVRCRTPLIPSLGWRVVKAEELGRDNHIRIEGLEAENEFFLLTLDFSGAIASLYDKKQAREVFREGELGNQLQFFEDLPEKYDAWEIPNYYGLKFWTTEASEIVPICDGARAGFVVSYVYMNSRIRQTIWLYEETARVDFETEVEWQQTHQLLKAAFPFDVCTDKATYEIQFGALERNTHQNTSWDEARFEVCAHKWADVSESGYGISLLNDCKYGHSAEGDTLKLTLLKGATFPDPVADKGHHIFTYSLYPHAGDWRQGTVKEAYSLNLPLFVAPISAKEGTLPSESSFLVCEGEGVIVDTVKRAEEGEALIVRLYEAHGTRVNALKLRFGFPVERICSCDLTERGDRALTLDEDGGLTLPLGKYEILTLKVFPGK